MDDEEYIWERLRGTVWNYVEKEHMESMCEGNTTITDEEWYEFVHMFQDAFADEVSGLALEFWNQRHYNGMAKMEEEK